VDGLGSFTVKCSVQSLTKDGQAVTITDVVVDTGSEYTWLPAEDLLRAGITIAKKGLSFLLANGTTITRDVGYAFVRSGQFETVDEIVFGRPGDLKLLGARTLEGFPARVDARERKLVAAGALPAALGSAHLQDKLATQVAALTHRVGRRCL
jgi:predicted aspartyl protease